MKRIHPESEFSELQYERLGAMKIREVQSYCESILPDLMELPSEKSVSLVFFVKERWPQLPINSSSSNQITKRNALFTLASFIALSWCDCCHQKMSQVKHQSPNQERCWNFCLECDNGMLPIDNNNIKRDDNFQWINYREMSKILGNSITPNLLHSISKRSIIIDHNNKLRYRGVSFIDKGRLSVDFYLLKDVIASS